MTMSYKEREKMYTVYKHTSPSGKVYIGITSLNIEKRWNNGKGYKDCTLFNNAIKKYGWNNFKHEIIAEGLQKEEACKMECELINKYKSKGISYNCSVGGELTAYGCIRSDDFRKKLSIANKGKKLSEETKKKLSENHKGKTPTVTPSVIEGRKKTAQKLKGRYFSAEHREKLSEAKKGKRLGDENPKSIKIFCKTNETIYAGISDAARNLQLDASSICKVCRGKLKHYKGYVFEYVGDVV